MNDYRNNWFYKKCSNWLWVYAIIFVIGFFVTISEVRSIMRSVTPLNIVGLMLGVALIALGGIYLFSIFPKLEKIMRGLSQEDLSSLGTVPPKEIYYATFYLTDRFLCIPKDFVLTRYDRIKKLSVIMHEIRGETYYRFMILHTDGSRAEVSVIDEEAFLKEQDEFIALIENLRDKMNSNKD